MNPLPVGHDIIKSALFVDFDNIYSGLRKMDVNAAEHFAADPALWLDWIERGLKNGDGTTLNRSVLVRRCYLNPTTFSRYRTFFTRAAFTVVDCPPLTQQGKNSSDIHMVMDILDALEHPTRFNEFIILSGDSDFTPVLLRLRAYDRRTIIMTAGAAAQAYKAASDLVVTGPYFVTEGLKKRPRMGVSTNGDRHPETVILSGDHLPKILDSRPHEDCAFKASVAQDNHEASAKVTEIGVLAETIAACAKRRVQESDKPVNMAALAQWVIDELGRVVVETEWAGAGGFKNLLRKNGFLGLKLASSPGGLNYLYDPERHAAPIPVVSGDFLPSGVGQPAFDLAGGAG